MFKCTVQSPSVATHDPTSGHSQLSVRAAAVLELTASSPWLPRRSRNNRRHRAFPLLSASGPPVEEYILYWLRCSGNRYTVGFFHRENAKLYRNVLKNRFMVCQRRSPGAKLKPTAYTPSVNEYVKRSDRPSLWDQPSTDKWPQMLVSVSVYWMCGRWETSQLQSATSSATAATGANDVFADVMAWWWHGMMMPLALHWRCRVHLLDHSFKVLIFVAALPSVLWHCWFGNKKGIRP